MINVGDRVVHLLDGYVGHVELIEEPYADVRWLTPKNVPSCYVSTCLTKDLGQVEDHVVPLPRSKEWWQEANSFYCMVCHALSETLGMDP